MKLSIHDELAIHGLTGGGFLANTFRSLVAAVSTGFNREHDVETNRHSTITATGSIAERNRTVPMGDWIAIPYGAVSFTGNGTMTWTVQAADQLRYSYMLIGHTLFLDFSFTTTSVGGVANTTLLLPLPYNYKAANSQHGTPFYYSDNGTFGIGLARVAASAQVVQLLTAGIANWTASANNTAMEGQLRIEII